MEIPALGLQPVDQDVRYEYVPGQHRRLRSLTRSWGTITGFKEKEAAYLRKTLDKMTSY